MQLVNPDIERYAESLTTQEPELLRQLVAESGERLEYIDMLSGRVVGQMLRLLVTLSGAEQILEIGTFTGYSALSMAQGLRVGGRITTCEINERYANIARKYFKASETGDRIDLRMGNALDTIETLKGPFDLVFLDADKVNYPAYYRKVKPLMGAGSLLVVDNTFWDGEVMDPRDEKAEAIDRLNRTIAGDPGMEQVMLTVRDGVLLARRNA